MTKHIARILLFMMLAMGSVIAVSGLTGCKSTGDHMEDAGENLGDAVEDVGDAVEDAVD